MPRKDDILHLPSDLPVPVDDGMASHLLGLPVAKVALRSTWGQRIDLSTLAGRTVVYCYPRTGRPDEEPLDGWNLIPGARGCTPQACAFRDHYRELEALGARVFGLSSQDTDYQLEAAERLHLPFPLLSDANLAFASAMRLPLFEAGSMRFLKRLTLIVRDGTVEHVFYPVFPPDRNAGHVLDWLRSHREYSCGPATDKDFAGSIPKVYDEYLVPLIFESYAVGLADRLRSRSLSRVLELAAGTGVVTRALASTLPESVSIVATDLNQAMLDQAAAAGTTRAVEWRQADAMRLPFPDGTFDAVVCQFAVMFFPDKAAAFAEARRVLKPAGVFLFNVWDRIAENEFADTVTTSLESVFPRDPPRFLARVPHGYYDPRTIARDLANGGFRAIPSVSTVAARSRATSPRIPAIAYCQGTPLRSEIEARDASRLGEATDAAAEAIAKRFGQGAVDAKIQAHIVTLEN